MVRAQKMDEEQIAKYIYKGREKGVQKTENAKK